MAFFPRYCSSDFAPLFQSLDDYDVHQTTHRPNKKVTTVRTFAPKFDVYESNDRYYLDGELPGVEQNDVDIEFSDPQTLVIKGRSQRNYHQEKHPESDDGSETSSVKSHQPTVEDWDEMIDATPTTEPTPAPTAEENTAEKSRPEPGYKFWASERSVGEFHRTFAFPTRVDQESVKASLKNGILSVVLPKEPAPQLKKVRVQ